jgi:hypothetical protein
MQSITFKATEHAPLQSLFLFMMSEYIYDVFSRLSARWVLIGVSFASQSRTSPDGYYGFGAWSSEEALGKASFSLMATALMAKDHFVSFLF